MFFNASSLDNWAFGNGCGFFMMQELNRAITSTISTHP